MNVTASAYLLDPVRPALLDAVLGPDVVSVLGQFVHQQLLTRSQFDVGQVQRGRLVTVGHHVAARRELRCEK